LLDHGFFHPDTTVVGGVLFLHPGGPIRLHAAPAVEVDGHYHKHFLFRLGGSVEVPYAGLTWAPTASVDFVSGKTLSVYGLTAGYGF